MIPIKIPSKCKPHRPYKANLIYLISKYVQTEYAGREKEEKKKELKQ